MASGNNLVAVQETGWRLGLSNLLDKENRGWWKTRRWVVQAVIWSLVINGIAAASLFSGPEPGAPALSLDERVFQTLTLFTLLAGLIPAIAVIIQGQDSVIGEKQTGTAAWILSKPVSRPAYILSKLAASSLGALVTMTLVPSVVFYLMMALAAHTSLPVLPFLASVAMIFLSQFFYIALTLMLGTLFARRGPVIGIGLVVALGFQFILGLIAAIYPVTPWALVFPLSETQPSIALALITSQPLPSPLTIPFNLLWVALMVSVAVWRFGREEF